MDRIGVCVSTMNQSDHLIIRKMNISTDAIIVNQTDVEKTELILDNNRIIKIIHTKERGLSRSRNRALNEADFDICLIADDDMIFRRDYPLIVRNAFEKYKKASIIGFYVHSLNKNRCTSKPLWQGYISYINSMRLSSFQLAIRKNELSERGLSFNEEFGSGSGKYGFGEENIFLYDAIRKGLKIAYVDQTIAFVKHITSNWFKGFNDYKYFIDRGAIFRQMSGVFSYPLIWQFALRKYPIYRKHINFLDCIKLMDLGRKIRNEELKDNARS